MLIFLRKGVGMLCIFSRRFIFAFLLASVTFVQIYSAVQEFTFNAQSKEEENYFKIQQVLLTELGKVPEKNDKEACLFIGKVIAGNKTLRDEKGFAVSFTTFDMIKDLIPFTKQSPQIIATTSIENNNTSENTEAILGSSCGSMLESDPFSAESINTINTNKSIYTNPFAHDQHANLNSEEKKEIKIAQPPIVPDTPNKAYEETNPFVQNTKTETTHVSASSSTGSSSEEEVKNKRKKSSLFFLRLFCIGPVNK